MQYFSPGQGRFVGDCMPFFHDGVFHLYYLLDQGHHQGRGGLGGHQWAHASTVDLRGWQHHPLALPVEEEWEGSICTGSVLWNEGLFHAFYATRKPDWTQHLSHAVSTDGIAFVKTRPLPVLPVPPGYDPQHFRDPFLFRDEEGRFQMLVTARREDDPVLQGGGCLLRLSSPDLAHWTVEGPQLFPGGDPRSAVIPECPDYFVWNGWHYLVFGLGLATHYRIALHPLGPWRRPPDPLLDSRLLSVMKTAPFGSGRRIGAAWIGTREGDRDAGGPQWGGNLVLRELVQHEDGTLSTRFVPELLSSDGARYEATLHPLTPGVRGDAGTITLAAPNGQVVAAFFGVPQDFRLRCRVRPHGDNARFGIGLRGSGEFGTHYALAFEPGAGRVTLADQFRTGVAEIARPFQLEVVCRGDLLDVCIGGTHCLINRLPESGGDRLFWFCEAGDVFFEDVLIL